MILFNTDVECLNLLNLEKFILQVSISFPKNFPGLLNKLQRISITAHLNLIQYILSKAKCHFVYIWRKINISPHIFRVKKI